MPQTRLISVIHTPAPLLSDLNTALSEVTTPFVAFLTSQSRMLPGHMERIENELTLRPDTEILVFDTVAHDSDGWTTLCSPSAATLIPDHFSGLWLSENNLVIATDLLHRVGPIDESLGSAAMIEYVGRCLLAASTVRKLSGEPTVIVPGSTVPASTDLIPALDACAASMQRNPSTDARLPLMLDVARMTLAGRMLRRGHKKEGTRLSDRVLDNSDCASTRIKLGFVRDTEAMFGRGGRSLGLILFRQERPGQGTVTEK